jgi:ABC-type dipeptide/oligopeptide/nickel transport system permease component
MRKVMQGGVGRWSMYVGRRLVAAVLTLLGVVVLVFVVTRLLGDPVQLILGPRATPEQVERLRQELGYDQSIPAQFWTYLTNLLQGDLGVSRYSQRSVSDEIASRFPSTIELATAGMLLGLLWTIPLGIIAALRPRGYVDRASQLMVEFGVAIPSFWLGLLLVLLFVNALGIAPTPVGELDIGATPPPRVTGMIVVDALLAGDLATFRDALAHLALPAIVLAITACPPILLLTRNTMIGVLGGDYVRGARSFGLPERTVRWYAFKNTLLPVSTMVAMTFGFLLGGTVLVETVFSWPGIGLYAIQSMQRFDYEPVLGIVLLASAVYVLVYFVADVLAMVIDPRVREST